ncbi:MAG: hypothetical protein ABI321_21720 [Polyangia bacterium]
MQRSSTLGLVFVALATSAGCAAQRTAHVDSRHPIVEAQVRPPEINGVWDWVYRSTDDQGDMRIEQEEWHLVQRNGQVDGYYDRVVTLMSTDDRLFRCNQKLGFTKTTRVKLSGKVEGDHVSLRETAFQAASNPCDDGARNLVAYAGTLRQGTLSLRWGPEAGQTLVRRTDGGTPLADTVLVGQGNTQGSRMGQAAGETPQPALAGPSASVLAAVPVEGTWEWGLRSIDAEGDERQEREEWHLKEAADGIRGYYDRTVKRIRAGGVYPCNGEGKYETVTRYTVTGQRFGDKLTLTEVDYKATPSRCDNALRRLDTYQGQVAEPDSLILSWGPGNQLLKRMK